MNGLEFIEGITDFCVEAVDTRLVDADGDDFVSALATVCSFTGGFSTAGAVSAVMLGSATAVCGLLSNTGVEELVLLDFVGSTYI